MRSFTTFTTVAIALLGANALPHVPHLVKRASNLTDIDVLNYALTLEYLEADFYKTGLAKFNQASFKKAGFAPFVRNRFEEVAQHEAAHVTLLSTVLGDSATQPCTYNFNLTNAKSFVSTSQILEGVGVTAYTGAAQFISNKVYLTTAASILATEARHQAWISTVNHDASWSGAFDVPLDLDEVYTLAAAFITSCPSTNPTLPVKAFPTLTLGSKCLKAGSSVSVKYANAPTSTTYIILLTGLGQIVAEIKDGEFVIPAGLAGTVYAVVSSANATLADATILAGPAILVFNFDSYGKLISGSC